MIWLFLTLGTVLVAAIALVAVGSAVRRLEESAMPVVLEVDDAVDWIAERLPAEAASQLSRDDVINIVGWYLEVFDAAGLVTDHGQELGDGALDDDPSDVVAPLDNALEHVVVRAGGGDDPLDAVSVAMAAELLGTYLTAMGAIGDPADPSAT